MKKKVSSTSKERHYWNRQYDSLNDDFDYILEDANSIEQDSEQFDNVENANMDGENVEFAEEMENYEENQSIDELNQYEASNEENTNWDEVEYAEEDGADLNEAAYSYEVDGSYSDDETYEASYDDEAYDYENDNYEEVDYEEAGYDKEILNIESLDNDNWDDEDDEHRSGFFAKLWNVFVEMETMDKVIVAFGLTVLVLVGILGGIYFSGKNHYNSVDDLVAVGRQIEDIDCIGEKGLLAVADATVAKLLAAQLAEEEQNEPQTGYDESEYSKQVTVQMSLTSVLKDLKIKFNNKSTGKLIANVPFSVEVTFSDGKTEVWTDDDKDGIIYKNKVTTGKTVVKVCELDAEKYENYSLPKGSQNVEVKSTIAYEKIDVKDEVKSEAEINVAVEDTAANNTVVESSLNDTVAWVESTASVNTYTQVPKTTIPDPTSVAISKAFMRIAGTVPSVSDGNNQETPKEETPDEGGTNTDPNQNQNTNPDEQKVQFSDFSFPSISSVALGLEESVEKNLKVSGATEGKKIKYTVSSSNVAAVSASIDDNGILKLKGVSIDKATIKVTAEYEEEDANKSKHTKTLEFQATVVGAQSIKLSKTSATVYISEPLSINAEVINGIDTSTPLNVASSNTNVATVKAGSYNAATKSYSVEITGVATGDAIITLSYKEANKSEIKATLTVVVKNHPKDDKKTLLVDANGKQVYVLENEKYREAVYADYYTAKEFYLKGEAKYTGWQTIDGKVYFYKADGNKVTGEQVIQGAKYNFASDGSLVTGNGTMGIDVSKWNGNIDWAAVKNSGVSYVIIRCGYRGSSQGMLVADSKYKNNISGALAAGLKVGVYFFTQAVNEVEAVEEASYVIDAIKGYKISYPVFLDVESSGGRGDKIDKAMRTSVCKTFCATIKNAGYTSGIYANKTWLNEKIDTNSLSAYKIWLAQYAATPSYKGRYDLWQYKSTGKVSGISGNVDLNLSYLGY